MALVATFEQFLRCIVGMKACLSAHFVSRTLRPSLKTVSEEMQEQLDLQAFHRVGSRLVSRRAAAMNQIRAFLIEQGITVRRRVVALRASRDPILENCSGEMSLRMLKLILELQQGWIWLD